MPSSGTLAMTLRLTSNLTPADHQVDPDALTSADILRCKVLVQDRRKDAGLDPWPFMHSELGDIIRRMGGDLDLAADACAMDPLPEWIVQEVMSS